MRMTFGYERWVFVGVNGPGIERSEHERNTMREELM